MAAFVAGCLTWPQRRLARRHDQNTTDAFIAEATSHPPNVTRAEKHEPHLRPPQPGPAAHRPSRVGDLGPAGGVVPRLDFYLVSADTRW